VTFSTCLTLWLRNSFSVHDVFARGGIMAKFFHSFVATSRLSSLSELVSGLVYSR
jgi:hypothetical protein